MYLVKQYRFILLCSTVVIGLVWIRSISNKNSVAKDPSLTDFYDGDYSAGSARDRNSALYTFLLKISPVLLPVPKLAINQPIIIHDKKLMFCVVPQNLDVYIMALFCRIYFANQVDPDTNDKMKLFLLQDCFNHQLTRVSRANASNIFNMEGLKKWIIIQDPLDKIVSIWSERCLAHANDANIQKDFCHSCGKSFACFLRRNLIRLSERSLNMSTLVPVEPTSAYWPQTWFCGYQHMFQDYDQIFYFENSDKFYVTIRNSFTEIGWQEFMATGWGPNKTDPFLQYHQRLTMQQKTANFEVLLKHFDDNLDLIDLAYRTYLIDYVTFSLKKPDWIVEICRKRKEISSLYLVCNHSIN